MNKNLYFSFLFVALAAMVFLNACNVEAISPTESLKPVLLSATIEEPSAAGTKAYIENTTEATKRVFWSADDVIMVCNKDNLNPDTYLYDTSNFSLTSGAGTSSATFSGTLSDARPLVAIYPADIFYPAIEPSAPCTLRVEIPDSQKYVDDSFDKNACPMIAYTETGNNLVFKNYCGLLKLQLTGLAKVKSIVITDNNSETYVVGGIYYEYILQNGMFERKLGYGTKSTITLDCDDGGGVQLNSSTPTAFYISAYDGAFSTGFSVTITDMLGNQMTKSTTKNNSIERSKITEMPPFEFLASGNTSSFENDDNGVWQ